jgi:hypothetical protein
MFAKVHQIVRAFQTQLHETQFEKKRSENLCNRTAQDIYLVFAKELAEIKERNPDLKMLTRGAIDVMDSRIQKSRDYTQTDDDHIGVDGMLGMVEKTILLIREEKKPERLRQRLIEGAETLISAIDILDRSEAKDTTEIAVKERPSKSSTSKPMGVFAAIDQAVGVDRTQGAQWYRNDGAFQNTTVQVADPGITRHWVIRR